MRLLILIAALATLVFAVGCDDDDCPSCPEPTDGPHYRMYVLGHGKLLMVDVPADTIIDSVDAIELATLEVNANHTKVFGLNAYNFNTDVYDAFTLEKDTVLDYYGEYHVDRVRGVGLMIEDVAGGDLVKFDGVTFEELDRISGIGVWKGQIDTTNGILYTVRADNISRLIRIDYTTMTILDSTDLVDSLGDSLRITQLLPIPKHDRLYAAGEPFSIVFGFPLQSDTALFAVSMQVPRFPFCNLVFDPYRNRVYMGEPGMDFLDIPPAKGLYVFDVTTDQLYSVYSTTIPAYPVPRRARPIELVMDSVGRYLYVVSAGPFPLLRYDLETGFNDKLLTWGLDGERYPVFLGAEMGALLSIE